ncbi:MAG TPA: Nramp family divalent metal transporter [Stellaceae bacterium]|nr:Nramp family divalent metal transporter [Stellaceae bacterium]
MVDATVRPGSLSERTLSAGHEALFCGRRGLRAFLPFFGPAVIASVAYMDPGNFATNIEAGGRYGYELVWVVVVANLIAMLFQALSAKLGIATGRNLAELCRERFPPAIVYPMWAASEIAAMATDLAEMLGAAIALTLIFGLPQLASLAVAGAVSYAMLLSQNAGFRPIEILIGGFVALIGASYLAELCIAPPDWSALAYHAVVPQLRDGGSVTLAVGIVGATVMPHAIYLHSGLTQQRIPVQGTAERRRLVGYSNREVLFALGIAGLVNIAMVAMAAVVTHRHSGAGLDDITGFYRTLLPLLGAGAAGIFLAALLASGLSSSVVGTMAGQLVMQGFVRFHIPLWARRLATMLPAFAVVAGGIGGAQALVLSQVVLSLTLPVPMLALLWLTADPEVMGGLVNARLLNLAATLAAILVLALNLLLLLMTAGVALP